MNFSRIFEGGHKKIRGVEPTTTAWQDFSVPIFQFYTVWHTKGRTFVDTVNVSMREVVQ